MKRQEYLDLKKKHQEALKKLGATKRRSRHGIQMGDDPI